MAAVAGRLSRQALLKTKSLTNTQQASFSFKSASRGKKAAYGLLGAATVGSIGAVGAALAFPVLASELELHPPHYKWSHHGMFSSIDMKSVRRGYEVYKQVCAACHSLKYLAYREMVGSFLSEDEAKEEAKSVMITDGPDDNGNMFERPGKLADYIPSPYKNEEAAKAANNGAVPPDLTYIVPGVEGEENYIFSLLTGYCDAPAGVEVPEDGHFNPYFTGGVIAMAEALYTDIIEYSDGTPATKSQLAKDVSTFLVWTSMPDFDDRKKLALKILGLLGTMMFVSYYAKRHYFTVLKARKIALREGK
ncbi:cytochrome c1, heme protein, mitochondrial-like [Mytilus edulis]|uniref:Ubiquinol-cytochrome c reductase cytochrome c1 subunit n=2 Tax=Mytilus TaxID=6548 RepID=A0A8B6FV92_MYTGA|nr:CYC1 [Mytilus edulis]VDI53368.1 ubiquinol-cytochrome c reductase cytochrome c1 subunit [Mytilus galloprovincialis]